jgi:hypothetical protein
MKPEGLVAKFSATSSAAGEGELLRFYWNLSDYSWGAEGQTVTHTFAKSGTAEVRCEAKEGLNEGYNTEQYRTVTLTIPTGPGDIGLPRWPRGIRIKADAFTAQGGAATGVHIRGKAEKVGADGGSISHWDPLNAWVEWPVRVPTADRYYVLLRYATPTNAERALSLDGKTVGAVKMASTGGYSSTADDWRMELLRDETGNPLAVQLAAGTHALRLTNTDAKGCNLNYIELLPAK